MKQLLVISAILLFDVVGCAGSVFWQGAQSPTVRPPALLTVTGEVAQPLSLRASDLAALPHRTVTAKDHQGEPASFSGITLIDILTKAGVKFGEDLRGKALSLYIVVKGSDGYQATFAIAELDPGFTDKVVILADRRNGNALSSSEGPLRIVVPDEKRQARWVRNVISISVRRAE
jgi:DMSO/TMAO reductase YedYZ molybdopterin-dependent catalytic subunit